MRDRNEMLNKVMKEVGKVIVGKDEVIEKVLMALLAKGHVLMEDIPGVGKTSLALAFSKVMELDCQRVQFTPDVLPSDIVGFSILNSENEFVYKPGVVLCNLFLADEINRTSSKTQSALLEVMEEGTVTVDGNTYPLPEPFFVMATQNPITSIGTQFLPESQLDRFMIKLSMGYPSLKQEIKMLQNRHNSNPLDFVQPLLSTEQVVAMQQEVADIYVQDAIYKYIVYLSDATRKHEELQLGLSPRGTLALVAMAKACAYLNGRDYVIPEDVQNVFVDVASHRVVLEQKAKMSHRKEEEVLQQILKQVARPQIKRDEDAC